MAKRKVRIMKYGGDDSQSWAVFVDGQLEPVVTGLNQRMAKWYRKQIEKGVFTWPKK